MPAKRAPDMMSESSDDNGMNGNFDPSRFTNPNYSREFVAALPAQIRARTNALLGLDADYMVAKKEHDAKIDALKKEFETTIAIPFGQRRKQLVTAPATQSLEADLVKKGVEDAEKKADSELKGIDLDAPAVPLAAGSSGTTDAAVGLPGFWLKALRRHVIVNDMITDRDAEILQHLVDITAVSLDAPANGFILRFEFDAAKTAAFFPEAALSKTFHLKEVFDELVVDATESVAPSWVSDEKNVTVKTVTKKQRSKGPKAKVRFVTKTEPCESFFNFFKAQSKTEGDEEDEEHDEQPYDEEDEEQALALAHVLKDKIIPFAVEYYTAEAADGSSDLEDDEDYEGEEEMEEEEEEEMPQPVRGGKPMGKGAPHPKPAGKAADCKQQ
jgi:nucleosome assembly protein 1-like 1